MCLIWPFVAIVVLLIGLGTASLQVIRGVRADIGAESVRSSAQKAAVEALEQQAQTRNEDYFDRYVSVMQRGRSVARAFQDGSTILSGGNVVLRCRHDGPVAIDYAVAPMGQGTQSRSGLHSSDSDEMTLRKRELEWVSRIHRALA